MLRPAGMASRRPRPVIRTDGRACAHAYSRMRSRCIVRWRRRARYRRRTGTPPNTSCKTTRVSRCFDGPRCRTRCSLCKSIRLCPCTSSKLSHGRHAIGGVWRSPCASGRNSHTSTSPCPSSIHTTRHACKSTSTCTRRAPASTARATSSCTTLSSVGSRALARTRQAVLGGNRCMWRRVACHVARGMVPSRGRGATAPCV